MEGVPPSEKKIDWDKVALEPIEHNSTGRPLDCEHQRELVISATHTETKKEALRDEHIRQDEGRQEKTVDAGEEKKQEELTRKRLDNESRINEIVAPFLEQVEQDLYAFFLRLKEQTPPIEKDRFGGGDNITTEEVNSFDHLLQILADQTTMAENALAKRGLTGEIRFFKKYESRLPRFVVETLQSVAREAKQVHKGREFYEYWNNARRNPKALVGTSSRFPDEDSVREQANRFLATAKASEEDFDRGQRKIEERRATIAALIRWVK